jgi:transposase InsO family protein
MCQVLEVTRSGYYAWRRRGQSQRQLENEDLLKEIKKIHNDSHQTYGSLRITAELRAKGKIVNKKRVARLMRVNDIRAKTRKKFKATTNSRHKLPVAPNILEQKFSAPSPNRIWMADITYIRTWEGWLYLCSILDLFTRKIVGWQTSHRATQELVINALQRAVWREKPAPGAIFHSDRGVQFASYDFKELLQEHHFIQSMSRKGNCYDSAPIESFFHTLKTEWVYHEVYRSRDQALRSLFEYIEIFYNRYRRHSSIGYRTPIEMEKIAKAA